MKFTDRSVKALKPKSQRYEVWFDGMPGFGVRVAPTGRRTFIFLYRFEGKPRRMTLGTGPYPKTTIADARLEYAKAIKKLDQKADPGAEKVAVKRADREADTVGELIDLFVADIRLDNKLRSVDAIARTLDVEVRPRWGRKKAKTITNRDVTALGREIKLRGAPVMANRTLSIVQRLFGYAVDEHILDATPYTRIKKPATETPRDRNLLPPEIKKFWNGLDGAEMRPRTRVALKLCLVTVQRRAEIAEARWPEFDTKDRLWTIPGSRTKNGKTHIVPLSLRAVALLDEIKAVDGYSEDDEYLFPSPRGKGPIRPSALTRAMSNNLKALGLADDPATPHDLRRTGDTQMGRLGVSRAVRDRILNHSDDSTAGKHYDQWNYLPEKRDALRKWSAEIDRILAGKRKPTRESSKVVRLRA